MLHNAFRFAAVTLIFFTSIVGGLGSHASGQSSRYKNSLEIVPQSATIYVSSMNHTAQWNAIINSEAYKQLNQSPAANKMRRAYRQGLSKGWEQFGDNPLRHYLEGYANSIDSIPGKLVWPYLEQVFANEVFFYADADFIKFTKAADAAYREFEEAMRYSSLDQPGPEQVREMLEAIRLSFKDVNFPTIVIGSIVEEPELFTGLISLAETGIQFAMDQAPPEAGLDFLEDAIRSESDGEVKYLAIEIQGSRIPWDQLTGNDRELQEFMPTIKRMMADKSIAICLAVKNNLATFSIGPSVDHVKRLATGPMLIDSPPLARIKQAVADGKQLTSVSYSSQEAMQSTNMAESAIDSVLGILLMMVEAIESDAFSPDDRADLSKKLENDANELKRDIATNSTKLGAAVSYCFLGAEGIEGFTFNYNENTFLDGSKPLELTRNVGPSPTLVVLNRDKSGAKQYEIMRKFGGRLLGYAQEYVPLMIGDEGEADHFETVVNLLLPVLAKIDKTTAEKFVPQTAGGETAIVIDLSIAKTKWHVEMPSSSIAVPFPGVAIVTQIKDRDVIKQAGNEYLEAAGDILEIAKELSEGEIPEEVQIPNPLVTKIGEAEMFYFALPSESGMDSSVAPHAVVGSKILCLGYLMDQSQAMVGSHNPNWFGPASENLPAMGVVFFDNREVMKAARAWIDYGFEQIKAQGESIEFSDLGESDGLDLSESEIRESVARAMNFFGCFQGVSSRHYMEDGVQVQHFLMRFQDVPVSQK